MRRSLLAAVLVVALVLPAAAAAHATMSEATPAVQGTVAEPPTEVRLRFDQAVSIGPTAIRVFDRDGRLVSGAARSEREGYEVVAPVTGLAVGDAYTVRWRTLSSDGHVGYGVFTFGVGVEPPSPTEAVGASGMTWKDDVARWALFVSLALLVGGLGFRLLVLPRDAPPALVSRVNLVLAIGAFAAIDVGIVAFVLRGANALQVSAVDLLYSDLSPFADGTRFGSAFKVMTVGLGLCATLVILAWVFDRARLLWPAFVLSALLLAGLSLSGHQATEPNSSVVTEAADWLHLLAASLWVGGVVLLATAVWPLAPELRRSAFLRFSRFATVLVAVVVLAGTYVAIVRLPAVSDLWATGYGQALLLKVGLACIALAWGAVHHFVVRPRLLRGEVPPRAGRSILGESTVVMAVLLLAAVLVNSSPPPVEAPVDDEAGAAQAAR
jgi:copper transport protein